MPALQYTPYIWPFVVSLLTTAALGVYAYRRRHVPVATTFALLMLALTVWTFCYVMELASATLADKTFWAKAKYFGSAPGPALWFMLAVQLTRNGRWLTLPFQLVLWAWATVTVFVVFTNDYHHWYWTDLWLVPGLPETESSRGFFFWIYAAMLYLFVVTGAILFVRYYRTAPSFYRAQASLMALGGVIPLSGRLLEDFFRIDIFPRVDNVILLLLVSGVLFAFAIFGYRALDLVHIAHGLVIQNIGAGIIVLDPFQRVIELNPYARALVGPGALSPVGERIETLLAGWPDLEIENLAEMEVEVAVPAGRRWFHVQSSRILAENRQPAGFAIALFDVTARKEAERQLEALARTDALTGVSNRRFFREQAEAELARAQRHGRPLAVLLLDIDHFKKVNDTFGHQVGDEVLKLTAAHCQRHLRTTDLFGRYGGEEFVCLLAEASLDFARQAAERIRELVEQAELVVGERRVPITTSIGLAHTVDGSSATLDALIRQADQALYAAKEGGRNRVAVWGE